MRERFSPLLYAWIYAVVVFIGHTVPEGQFSRLTRMNDVFRFLFSDKMLHFFVLGIFAWLLCFGFYRVQEIRIPYGKIFLLALSYGILLEAWQALIPFRSFQLSDLLYDLRGIVFFMMLFWMMKEFRILLSRT